MIYYIGDLHFRHSSIIKLCNRPFNTIEEMDATLIRNWNRKVKSTDTVYILGDFAYRCSSAAAVDILKSLNGEKVLIVGNHDCEHISNHSFKSCFKSVYSILTIYDGSEKIVLCHYPILEWDGYFSGSLHIHGHVHNNRNNKSSMFLAYEKRALNASAEVLNYEPCTLLELQNNNTIFKRSILC